MTGAKLFWGLHVESGKAYTQTVNQGFAIRQAVIERKPDSNNQGRKSGGGGQQQDSSVRVLAKYENSDFILCALSPNKLETSQVPLNVKFETGAQLTLRVDGAPNTIVHLTGYCIPSPSTFSTPSSAIAIPFEGQQKSILVSSKKNGPDPNKPKKRVSLEEVPKVNNKSVSFGAQEDDDDDDDDDDEDDLAFIRNGLAMDGDDDDDDDDDDDEEGMEEATTEDDTDEAENDSMAAIFSKKIAELNKKLKEEQGDEVEIEEDDDDDDDDEEEDDDDDSEEEDDEEDVGIAVKGKSFQSTPKSSKIPEKTAKSDPTNKSSKKPAEIKTTELKTPPGKKNQAELKTPEQTNKNAPKAPSSAGHTPMKFVSKGGVMVQEMKVGTGPVAKPGKVVVVYYQGRLKSNNKLFDKSESGPGFKFRLGKGEVIRGWDIGVEGMKVGGKRKVIIPANLAYGKRGAPPDIPPNATLTFDIELKNVH